MSVQPVDLGALGRTVFREVMGVKKPPTHQILIRNITRNLDELEQLGMTPERIALLQNCIAAFSDVVCLLTDVLIEKRKILNETIDSSGSNLTTFTEFKNLSKLSVAIKYFSDENATFIDRMHNHLYTLVDRDIDTLADSGYSPEKTEAISTHFRLLSLFLHRMNNKMNNRLEEVIARIKTEGAARHLGHLKVDVSAEADRLLTLQKEHEELSAKYDALLRGFQLVS